MLISEYKRIKEKLDKKKSCKKNIPISFWEFFYFKLLYWFILISKSSKYSFKLLIEDEKNPLGIDFNQVTVKKKAKNKSNAVRQAYLEEYYQLHHQKQKKAIFASISGTILAVIVVVAINVAISVYLPIFNRAPVTTHAAGESWVVGYTYRRAITIDNTKVATTTDAFAVLATTTLATLKTTGNGGNVENVNGYDIVWADSDGDTLLNFEVEKYDATTGEVVHWINTDISSTTDKVLYMYYGNDSISTDQSDKNNTWTSDHVGVWHFPDNLTASTTDSTGNNVNGIPAVNASSTDEGQLGGSFSFDAAEGTSLDLGSNTDLRLLGTSYTISLWTRPNVVDLSQHIVSHTDDTNGYSIRPATGGDGDLIFNAENSVINDTPASSFGTIGQWYHIVVAYNSTGTNTQFYIDGVSVDSDSESDLTLPSGNLYLGSRAQNRNTSMYNGNIDEFRILSSALTDADILTQYNNQSANAEFITIASEETANNAPSTPSSAVQYFSTTTRAIANTDYTSAQQID
jgi:hypothetical protein